MEIWDARWTAWTENEFQRAADAIAASGTKLSKRTILGCKEVFVNQKTASEVSNELGLIPGQLRDPMRLFVDLRSRSK